MSPLTEVLADEGYRRRGVATMAFAGTNVVLVDPARHQLDVWTAGDPTIVTYSRRGRDAGVVATNGPLVGRRLPGLGQVDRRAFVAATAEAATLAALATTVVRRNRPRRRSTPLAVGGVALIAAGLAVATMLRDWQPCGQIVRDGRRSEPTFDDEGPHHAHIARIGAGYGGVVIGDGHPPPTAIAGMGGLIRLVRDGASGVTGADGTGRLRSAAPRAVGWGLVPTGPGGGVLVVAGGGGEPHGEGPDVGRLAEVMMSLGVVDAVATDPSGCSMLAVDGRHILRPTAPHRRAIQRVGLCCTPCGGP